MRVTPFTQPVCAVGANSGGLAAPKKRSQHDHKCERGMGEQKDFESDPFHTTGLRCRRKLGRISCSPKAVAA